MGQRRVREGQEEGEERAEGKRRGLYGVRRTAPARRSLNPQEEDVDVAVRLNWKTDEDISHEEFSQVLFFLLRPTHPTPVAAPLHAIPRTTRCARRGGDPHASGCGVPRVVVPRVVVPRVVCLCLTPVGSPDSESVHGAFRPLPPPPTTRHRGYDCCLSRRGSTRL